MAGLRGLSLRVIAVAAVMTVPPGTAVAQSDDEARGAIPFDEFRALADGKTLYFQLLDGRFWGREYYVPGTQESVFVFADGECFEGYWTYRDQVYCYHYRDQPSCWRHFWLDGAIAVESGDGLRQVVAKIAENEPLSCKPELLSQGPHARLARFSSAAAPERGATSQPWEPVDALQP